MPVRTAEARWEGDLRHGKGFMRLGSGLFEGAFSYGTRFEEAPGTNPEELIGAAHAGCFSMALSNLLSQEGTPPERVETKARVHLELGPQGASIRKIELECEAKVPGLSAERFQELAEQAKQGCPVSRALAGVEISLTARLVS
jgi:osmotically inducible protein OsmC